MFLYRKFHWVTRKVQLGLCLPYEYSVLFRSPSYMNVFYETSTVLFLPYTSNDTQFCCSFQYLFPYLPLLSISPLDAPILVTVSFIHNYIFNLTFLLIDKCPISSLTLHQTSVILQIVAWLLLTQQIIHTQINKFHICFSKNGLFHSVQYIQYYLFTGEFYDFNFYYPNNISL